MLSIVLTMPMAMCEVVRAARHMRQESDAWRAEYDEYADGHTIKLSLQPRLCLCASRTLIMCSHPCASASAPTQACCCCSPCARADVLMAVGHQDLVVHVPLLAGKVGPSLPACWLRRRNPVVRTLFISYKRSSTKISKKTSAGDMDSPGLLFVGFPD